MKLLTRLPTKIAWARLFAAILIAAQVALCAPPVQAASPTYIVQRGDTLSLIARRYDTTVRAIAELNGIVNPNLIYVSQRLLIPSAGHSPPSLRQAQDTAPSQIHVVRPGETLTRIASRYGTTVSAIVAANGIADPSLILVGQRLAIPGSAPSAPLPSPFLTVELKPQPAIKGRYSLKVG